MRRAVLRAVDAKRVPMAGREPGLADLVGWLREHPGAYAQLLETAQVALSWLQPEGGAWYRWRAGRGSAGEQNAACRTAHGPVAVGIAWRQAWRSPPGDWRATVLGVDIPGEWVTAEEARAAVDAELVRQGWTLVGRGDAMTPGPWVVDGVWWSRADPLFHESAALVRRGTAPQSWGWSAWGPHSGASSGRSGLASSLEEAKAAADAALAELWTPEVTP